MEEESNTKWVVGIVALIVAAAVIFAFLQNVDLSGTSDAKLDTIIATTNTIDTTTVNTDATTTATNVIVTNIEVITLNIQSTVDGIEAEVEIIEEHVHNRERWFGIAAPQTATNWGELASLSPYRAISGNGDFGTDLNDEALVIGIDDTPAIAGMLTYDAHRLMVTASSNAGDWVVRIIYGMGTMAAAEGAGQYSDLMVQEAKKGSPIEVIMPRTTCTACQVWIRAKNAANNATIDFFIGIHEYPITP